MARFKRWVTVRTMHKNPILERLNISKTYPLSLVGWRTARVANLEGNNKHAEGYSIQFSAIRDKYIEISAWIFITFKDEERFWRGWVVTPGAIEPIIDCPRTHILNTSMVFYEKYYNDNFLYDPTPEMSRCREYRGTETENMIIDIIDE